MGKKMLILNLIKNLRKRLKLILFTTILSMAAVWGLINYIMPPDFQATSQIFVEEMESSQTAVDRQPQLTGPSIIEISSAAIRSPEVLKRVIAENGLDPDVKALHDQVAVSKEVDSQVLNITVTGTDQKKAAIIADAVAAIFLEEAPTLMLPSEMTLISSAAEQASASPIDKNTVLSLGVAGAFGLIVGTLLAFILELLNAIFKTGPRDEKRKKEKLQTVFK